MTLVAYGLMCGMLRKSWGLILLEHSGTSGLLRDCFALLPAIEDGSTTIQIMIRAENAQVQDAVYKSFFAKYLHKTNHFLSQLSVKRR